MQQTSVQTIIPYSITVPAGVTLGVFISALPGQSWLQIKCDVIGSGATLVILPASSTGSTMPGATLAAIYAGATLRYGLAAGNMIEIPGPASFYLAAAAAACSVNLLNGVSPQAGIFPPG